VICYHTTDAAAEILRDGFRDATGSYMLVGIELTGVWLGEMDVNEGAKGGARRGCGWEQATRQNLAARSR
jgi:hypothetical protein